MGMVSSVMVNRVKQAIRVINESARLEDTFDQDVWENLEVTTIIVNTAK